MLYEFLPAGSLYDGSPAHLPITSSTADMVPWRPTTHGRTWLIFLLFEMTFLLSPLSPFYFIYIFLGTSGITKGLCVFIIDRPKGVHPEIVFEGSSYVVPTRHPAGFLGIRQVCIMGGGGIKPKSFDCSILFISLSLSLSLSVVITDIYWTLWRARHSRLLLKVRYRVCLVGQWPA